MATQAERTASTRAALIEAAAVLFTERGFAGTSTDDIVATAGVTRGALYHHFADKRDLFIAVFHDLQARLEQAMRKVGSFTAADDPFQVFIDGCRLFLDIASKDPAVARVILTDAPAVIGPEQWRQLDAQYADASIGLSLRRLRESGHLRDDIDIPTATAMLNGAMNEATLLLARNRGKRGSVGRIHHTLNLLFDALRRR